MRPTRRLNWLHNLNHLLSYFFRRLLIEICEEDGRHLSWRIVTIKEFEGMGGSWSPVRWYWFHR